MENNEEALITFAVLPSVPEEALKTLALEGIQRVHFRQLSRIPRPLVLVGGTACEEISAAAASETEIAYLVVRQAMDPMETAEMRSLADDVIEGPLRRVDIETRGTSALRKKLRTCLQRTRPLLDDTGVSYLDSRIALSDSEQILLGRLLRARETTVPRQELARVLWQEMDPETGRAVDAHVYRLRKKLQGSGMEIETVRQRGFRLVVRRK